MALPVLAVWGEWIFDSVDCMLRSKSQSMNHCIPSNIDQYIDCQVYCLIGMSVASGGIPQFLQCPWSWTTPRICPQCFSFQQCSHCWRYGCRLCPPGPGHVQPHVGSHSCCSVHSAGPHRRHVHCATDFCSLQQTSTLLVWLDAGSAHLDRDMFSLIWGPTVAAVSIVLDHAEDESTAQQPFVLSSKLHTAGLIGCRLCTS